MTIESPAIPLRRLLETPGLIVAPGALDALSARLMAEAEFSAVYASGAAIANTLLGLPDIGLVSFGEAIEVVRRMADASPIPVIARTDSLATHGFDEAVARARGYAAAGADVVFVDAPVTAEQVAALPSAVGAPMFFNMAEGAKTPLFSHAELAGFGYKIVIHPSLALRVAAKATLDALRDVKRGGGSANVLPRILDWAERHRLVNLPEYAALERRYAS